MNENVYISNSYLLKAKSNSQSNYIVINPFINDNIGNNNKNPSICLNCASYYNPLDKQTNDNNNKWNCHFCNNENEINHKDINVVTDRDSIRNNKYHIQQYNHNIESNMSTSNDKLQYENIYAFALPSDICNDTGVHSLLHLAISNLPSDSRVCIIIYNRSIQVLCLSDLMRKGDYLSCDCLPGYKYDECLWEKKLISNKYVSTNSVVLSKYSTIVSTLQSLSTNYNIKQSCDGICTIASLLSFLISMKSRSKCRGIRLISFNTRCFVLGNLNSNPWSIISAVPDNVQSFQLIGKLASKLGVYIDIICAGLHGIYLDKLIALAYTTGGRMISNSSNFNELFVINNMNVYINTISQLNLYSNISIDIRTRNSINLTHLTIGCVDREVDSNYGGLVDIKLVSEEISHRLNNSNSDQLTNERTTALISNNNYNAYVIHDIIAYNNMKIVLEIESDYDINECNVKNYIQIIIRYAYTSSNSNIISEITNVITVPMTITNNIVDYLENINTNTYIYGLGTTLVSIYHHLNNQEANNNTDHMNNIVTDLTNDIDQIAISFTNLLTNNPIKSIKINNTILEIIRMLYHLKEGPLINNNFINNPQETCLLRAIFLTSSPISHSTTYLIPSLRLLVLDAKNNQNIILHDHIDKLTDYLLKSDQNDDILDCFIEVSPCTTSLLYHSIAVLECGDTTVVRPGLGLTNQDICQGVPVTDITKLIYESFVNKYKTYQPIPQIIVIPFSDIIKPADRLIFSRLSPSHKDTTDTIILSTPYYSTMSIDNKLSMIETFPYTDQESFNSYISRLNSNYCNMLYSYDRSTDTPTKPMTMDSRKLDILTKNNVIPNRTNNINSSQDKKISDII